jgi:hypothetical protein
MVSPDFTTQGLSDFVEGESELSSMILESSRGEREDYPLVARLNLAFDARELLADFEAAQERLRQDYLEQRHDQLGRPLDEVREALFATGFRFENYGAWALMRTGTCDLVDETPAYTRRLLEKLAPFCRAHYVIARPGTEIKKHVDCADYRTHGFRIHIPLFNSAFYTFHRDGRETEVELTPGSAWFVNNAYLHSAYNRTARPRFSLLLQMMSDRRLFQLLESGA